jgi:hypothetical protein
MGKPYSEDLWARVVVAERDGATIAETAEQLGVSISLWSVSVGLISAPREQNLGFARLGGL